MVSGRRTSETEAFSPLLNHFYTAKLRRIEAEKASPGQQSSGTSEKQFARRHPPGAGCHSRSQPAPLALSALRDDPVSAGPVWQR